MSSSSASVRKRVEEHARSMPSFILDSSQAYLQLCRDKRSGKDSFVANRDAAIHAGD